MAAPTTDDAVVVVLEGQGNGHGRGLSQWGSYGWATTYDKDWRWILDHYYGGTQMGEASRDQRMTVRLLSLDGLPTSVIAPNGDASVNDSGSYSSVTVRLVPGTSSFDAWGSDSTACPDPMAKLETGTTSSALEVPNGPVARGSADRAAVTQIQVFLSQLSRMRNSSALNPGGTDGLFGPMTENAVKEFQRQSIDDGDYSGDVDGVWDRDLADVARNIIDDMEVTSDWAYLGRFKAGSNGWAVRIASDDGDDPDTDADEVLGVCQPSGSVKHYRGAVVAAYASGSTTPHRTVNDVPVEQYLRGVVPRESPASWADAAGGKGINALRAQSVAARSYGLAQGRYAYAKSCDTDSCQVYGGAASRPFATGAATVIEDARSDAAIEDTAYAIRVRASAPSTPVSTEFSSSNGDRTAGGAFPAVDDPGDAIDANPWRWTRVLDVSALASRYGLSTITDVKLEPDPNLTSKGFGGMWANRLRLYNGSKTVVVGHDDLRSTYGLPSINFSARIVTRGLVSNEDFVFVGDSVGESIAPRSGGGAFPSLLSGVFASTKYDALSSRCTVGNCVAGQLDGLGVVRGLTGSPDVVLVELGYNDSASAFPGRIDQVMQALDDKGVRLVLWVNLSERRQANGTASYAAHNRALREAANEWSNLRILDWNTASSGGPKNRWYTDGVHLTTSGQAQFALWLRDQLVGSSGPIEQSRVYGQNRYSTAVQIAQSALASGAVENDHVVIVNGNGTVDGLAAAGYAGSLNAAVLLTQADRLPDDVIAYLRDNTPRRVTIVGGTTAVNEAVESQIDEILGTVTIRRVEGSNRYDTAVQLAGEIVDDASFLYVASGVSQVDALSIAPAAFAASDPLVLSGPNGLDDATVSFVQQWWAQNSGGRVVLVGGTSVLPAGVEAQITGAGVSSDRVTRLAGPNRYATSAAAVVWIRANVSGFADEGVGMASGQSPIDSLTSAPFLAGADDAFPLLLVPPCGEIPAETKFALASVSRQVLIGGPAAICDALALSLKQLSS
jgi:lysophospholipase L1-like esterase/peptidoglycan hydrolase-like protein with peptidoglycan-binding domain